MTDHFIEDEEPSAPIFLDRTGRRWPRIRRGFVIVGGAVTILMIAFAATWVLVPPLLPDFRPAQPAIASRFSTSRMVRLRRAKREQLYAALEVRRTASSIRDAAAAIGREIAGTGVPGRKPIRAAFYVWWADNSLASFQRNHDDIDWIVCEWGYLSPTGQDVDFAIRQDTSFFGVYDSLATKPKVFLLVNNFNRKTQLFDNVALVQMLSSAANRARVEKDIINAAVQYRLAGVTIDFEGVPPGAMANFATFQDELGAELHSRGLILTQTFAVGTDPDDLKRFAPLDDYMFLMVYDEHYGKGTPGPIASQSWFVEHTREMLRSVPAAKAIVAFGAYGYDWNDAGPESSGSEYTFQEVLAKGRDNPGSSKMSFDRASLNPYMTWTDPDSTDHLVWYLDGATAYNQVQATLKLGAAGYAVWRLGAEDPAFWHMIAADNVNDANSAFAEIPPVTRWSSWARARYCRSSRRHGAE